MPNSKFWSWLNAMAGRSGVNRLGEWISRFPFCNQLDASFAYAYYFYLCHS